MTICKIANFILPVNDVLGRNLRQLPFGKVGQNLLLDDALFGEPGVELQLGLDVLLIIERQSSQMSYLHRPVSPSGIPVPRPTPLFWLQNRV